MTSSEQFLTMAKRSMLDRCAKSGPCPLSVRPDSTQKLVNDANFKSSVIRCCPRMSGEEKSFAILKVECEK
jgi:hypothetical protein